MSTLKELVEFIKRVSKGFDFLGCYCRPTGMTVSEATLSRRDQKIVRFYEKDASKERVRAYLRLWIGWAGVLWLLAGVVVGCTGRQPIVEETNLMMREFDEARIKERFNSCVTVWSDTLENRKSVFIEGAQWKKEHAFILLDGVRVSKHKKGTWNICHVVEEGEHEVCIVYDHETSFNPLSIFR